MKQVEISLMLRMFLHSCVALSMLTVLSMAETCIQDDSCSCHTSTKKISLKSLSSTTGNPSFSVQADANTVYFYNPCKEFTKQAAGGQPVIADVIQQQIGIYYALGQDNTATFSGDPDQGTLTLTYSHKDSDTQTRLSIFSLKCAPGKKELQFIIEKPELNYHFTLNTDLVCTTQQSGGLSTGSILVILFFVFLVVYLIAGILFLRFVRRAEGLEMVPNVEFWKGLPSLIRDGCCFTFRGCKAESTYEKI